MEHRRAHMRVKRDGFEKYTEDMEMRLRYCPVTAHLSWVLGSHLEKD
jgi:hypothetical protein